QSCRGGGFSPGAWRRSQCGRRAPRGGHRADVRRGHRMPASGQRLGRSESNGGGASVLGAAAKDSRCIGASHVIEREDRPRCVHGCARRSGPMSDVLLLAATRAVIERTVGAARTPPNAGADTPLADGFWLDSIELVEVLVACEHEFGVLLDETSGL